MRTRRVSRGATWIRAVLVSAVLVLGPAQTPPSHAEGIFISASSAKDMVYDRTRDIVYITNGQSVVRYHLGTGSSLTPFELGGSLLGIDLSPDGNALAVADSTYSGGQNWIHLIDLRTGESRREYFNKGRMEGGTYMVAFAGDGAIFVTSEFLGSGWVPFRRYDPASDTTSIVASRVRQDTMLAVSADGDTVVFAERNSSGGPWGTYHVPTGSMQRRRVGRFLYEIGVNRRGTQYALPTYYGTYVYDSEFRELAILGRYAGAQPIGVAYHPYCDMVYFAWWGTREVRAFDTNSLEQVGAYDVEYTFPHNGNHAFRAGRLRISRGGRVLMAKVGGGVRVVRLDEHCLYEAYLPVVLKNTTPRAPDLVVEQIVASANGVDVTIRNQGDAAVVDEFWVDVYIDPKRAPAESNEVWWMLAEEGLVWGVTTELQAGEALTLTVGDEFYWEEHSDVAWPLAEGSEVWAQVDSANLDSTHGGVLELDEIMGWPYNNIAGPVFAADGLDGEVPAGGAAPSAEGQRRPGGEIWPRPTPPAPW